jgi:hypothetical protein
MFVPDEALNPAAGLMGVRYRRVDPLWAIAAVPVGMLVYRVSHVTGWISLLMPESRETNSSSCCYCFQSDDLLGVV